MSRKLEKNEGMLLGDNKGCQVHPSSTHPYPTLPYPIPIPIAHPA